MERPGSPDPSNLSMKSDDSKEQHIDFGGSVIPDPSFTIHRFKIERPVSWVPSNLSMKSDDSKEQHIDFGGGSLTPYPRIQKDRPGSPSNLSLKSHVSKEQQINFGDGSFTLDPRYSSPEDVSCDFCTGMKRKAVKYCQVCPAAYCVIHVRKHYTEPALQRHRLVEVNGDQETRLCQQHCKALELFCQTDKTLICSLCSAQEHRNHDTIFVKDEHVLAEAEQISAEEFYDELSQKAHRQDEALTRVQDKLKSNLKRRFECIFEGVAEPGKKTVFNDIYTELYITEGTSGSVNAQHEVWQIAALSKKNASQETSIKCNDIFKLLSGPKKAIRTVLTKGIAGIGKTVSVQKFILDWAEGKENQDVHFVFFLPFRELNLINDDEYSLIGLFQHFYPEMKEIGNIDLGDKNVLLIFDGLEESQLPLDFQNNKIWRDVTQTMSLDVLLTNLIRGDLCSSAHVWITSRPAAAGLIPAECVERVTEVRGFNDQQKEDYIRKRLTDESLAGSIITHIKSSRSLYIMCHIPLFCWVSATVLEQIIGKQGCEVPKTVTEMYTQFLIIQTIKEQKYLKRSEGCIPTLLESDKDVIIKLGHLAFQHLEKNSFVFCKEDLRDCGLDVTQASLYSGLCTEIFKEDSGLFKEKFYSFIHLSMQEYFAALYVYLQYSNNKINLLSQSRKEIQKRKGEEMHVFDLHRIALDKAVNSENGHLDLFVRFLVGLSQDCNQRLLSFLFTQSKSIQQSQKKTINYIKELIRKGPSPERSINLFHCLNELKDTSLMEEVKQFLRSGSLSGRCLSPEQLSALAFVLMMAEEPLDVFDMKTYTTSMDGCLRLLPLIKYCRQALLDHCNLTGECCKALISAVQSNPSHLRVLDLRSNYSAGKEVKLLCSVLRNPACKMETLRLSGCQITECGCEALASALQSRPSSLTELDLSHNCLGDTGVKKLFALLETPSCKLEKLNLGYCLITEGTCSALASALRTAQCQLKDLDLRDNDLRDSGVKELSAALEDPHCKLERLGLSGCWVTEVGCAALAEALQSNTSRLRELDLSYNHPGDSGVKLLSAVLEDKKCKLQKLNVDHIGKDRDKPGLLKYACDLTLNQETAHRRLALSEENRKVTVMRQEQPCPDNPERFDYWSQVLCREELTGRCYWEAEWSGKWVSVGVAYKEISRKGWSQGPLGSNNKSWSFNCSDQFYSICHKESRADIPVTLSSSRIGVYLDCPAGTLSFYSISHDTPILLHTVFTTFTEPLYPGFWVWGPDSTVSLCQIE